MAEVEPYIKCSGCELTTPFFGEIYGRMSEKAHGSQNSGMGHDSIDNDPKSYELMNTFKNKTLIPFYSTVIAIKFLVATIQNSRLNSFEWEKINTDSQIGLQFNAARYISQNQTAKRLFKARLFFALIPIVGTIVNGSLDLIAQIGLAYRTRGANSIQPNRASLIQ
jgi:hypothetical protein